MLPKLCATLATAALAYEPTWESLDQRPAPSWFLDEKFYVFVHWGLFSVPAWTPTDKLAEWYKDYLIAGDKAVVDFHHKIFGNESCTVENCTTYSDFKHHFKAELWDPRKWTALFKRAGARGVMFTTKHCDGYTHWKSPSKPGYNSVEAGPKRDIVADLTEAVRETDLRLGFYYCDCEWGQNSPDAEWPWPTTKLTQEQLSGYADKVWYPDMVHLASTYEPDFFFPDYGSACGFDSGTLRSREYLAWLYTNSTIKDKVIMGDRLGSDANCKHGDYYTCTDRYQPSSLQNHLWMDCNTIGYSWGLNRNEGPDDYKTAKELVHTLVNNVAYGGVLTLNVGPAADGTIIPLQAERLLQMGDWLDVNGNAIYKTRPWPVQQHDKDNDTGVDVFYTQKGEDVYAIMTAFPAVRVVNGEAVTAVTLASVPSAKAASLLGFEGTLGLHSSGEGLRVVFPQTLNIATTPCDHAWSIKLEGVPARDRNVDVAFV